MSEQGTEKTNPLHGLEPEQPEQRRCECGQSEFDGRVWSWRGVGTRRVCVANSTLSGYCPACGCRLSVVDGEPRVGEAYADLERDAQRFRAVAAHVSEQGTEKTNPLHGLERVTEWGHETWEPTQDTRGSSNPPEPAAQDTLQAKIAELEAALERERRAVEVLAMRVAADWLERNPTKGGCSEGSGDAWAAWAHKQAADRATEADAFKRLRSGLTHGRLDAMTGQIICPACGGSGWQNNWCTTAGTVCTTCNGSGVVDAEPPAQDTLTIMAERDKLQARVAELEAENERLRTAIAALRKPRT